MNIKHNSMIWDVSLMKKMMQKVNPNNYEDTMILKCWLPLPPCILFFVWLDSYAFMIDKCILCLPAYF